jgi:ELWxxDGT repeat protein
MKTKITRLLSLICLLSGFNISNSHGQTALVKDIEAGTPSAMSSSYFVTMGTAAYFAAYTSANSYELWKTDATTAGTTLLKDINPGTGNANPSSMFVNGTTLYFLADNGTNGKELWKSDGTTAGTSLVKDIAAGTTQGVYNYTFFGAVGSTIFFQADAGSTGYELWKSDGTTAGTVLVKDILAGTSSSFSSTSYSAVVGSTFFFTANDGTNGTELWKSDGTTAGTVLVKDIYTGSTSSYPQNFSVLGSTLYFTATTSANGVELWKSDGTTAGTVMVKDINAGASSSNPIYFTTLGANLLFRANNGTNGIELWKTDGTTAGTIMVSDIYAGSSDGYPENLKVHNGVLYFTATTAAAGSELWKSDGTTGGTTLVKDIYSGTTSSYASDFTSVGTTLFFTASTSANGNELWKTDGTTAGTVMVRDITLGTSGSSPSNLANMNGTLYFQAYLDVAGNILGNEIFKSDGTAAGTLLVNDMYVGGSSQPHNFLYLNSTILFIGADNTSGTELFKVTTGHHKMAYFTANPTNLYTGSPYNFTNFTDQTPNDPISWSWTFTGGTPSTSTAQNPSNIVYNTPGCYQVTLTTTFASGSDVETKTCYIVVASINSLYCTTIGSGTAGTNYINGVTVGSINNLNTGALNGPSYHDYTSMSTNMNQGQSYNITVDGRGGSNVSYAAFIDYNRDGDFDDTDESLGQAWGWIDPSNVRTITFTVPAGTYIGTTRLRIRDAVDNFGSSNFFLEGCSEGSWQDGENEDYSVVLAGGLAPVANFSASNTSPSAGSTINFTDLSTNTPTSWSWSFTGGSPATSTSQNPTNILYNTPGCYQVTLTATNAYGSDPEVKTCYINVLNPALAPVANFVASNTGVAVGGSINYTDLSTNSPTSWSWSFPGGSPATSTLQNPTGITYSTAGVYNAVLTATNANGSNTMTKTNYITVQNYCTPTGGSASTDYISRVEAFSVTSSSLLLDNPTTAGGAYYKNYTSMTIPLSIGEQYLLSAEGNSPSGSPNSYGAFWIDWNKDGDFMDAGEKIYEDLLDGFGIPAWGWQTPTMTVPATAALGATRLRVRINRPSAAGTDACGGYAYGETEDYRVFISPGAGGTAPVANFSASSTALTTGGNTNFTDLSTNTPTSWSWAFTGGTPATSTVQNPTGITYPTAGCYQVTLTATNAAGSDSEVKTCYINVTSGGGGSYCAITTSTYGTSDGDFIDGVTLGTINNINSGSMGGPFYNNYTSMSTNLAKTSSYTVNIKSGTWPATYPDYYAAWIDYNNDSDFTDAGEKLGEFLSTAPSTTQGISFTVPASATTGNTRMRVRGVWASAAGIDPCLAYDYGETEDYTVNITAAGGGSAPVANFSASSTNISVGGSTNFTDLSTNSPTSWSWTFTGGTPATSTVQNPAGITYPTAGCYQVSLTATNASGSDPEVKTCYINVTSGGGGSTCDTLQNYQNTNTIVTYTNTGGGYVAGHNSYGDLAKADLFTTYTAGYRIKGAYLAFSRAKYSTTAKTISVKVWDDNGAAGVPNTVLATKTVTIASIAPDVTAGNFTYVQFASPVVVTGPFYLGIEFAYATGDTVALYTNSDGETTPGTAWEKFSTADWHAMSEAATWGINVSLLVRPLLCSPTTETEDFYSGLNFNVYPNPNAGEFTLEVLSTEDLPVTYSIINSVGKEIVKKEIKPTAGNHTEKISLDEYASGIYYVIMQSGDHVINKKLVVQK